MVNDGLLVGIWMLCVGCVVGVGVGVGWMN